MSCKSRKYEGVDREKMQFVRIELRSLGLTVPDEEGGKITSIEIGVEAEFKWMEVEEVLWVKISTKPYFIPCAYIYHRLERAILTGSGAADPNENMADFM